jgi:hypothetical protein
VNQFFTGLVERATRRVPVLERRPRGLFEPAAAQGGVAIEGIAPAAPDEREGRIDPIEREDAPSALGRDRATGRDPAAHAPRLEDPAEPAPPDRGAAVSVFRASRPPSDEPRVASAAGAPHGERDPVAPLDAQRDERDPVTRRDPRSAPAPREQPQPSERRLLAMPPRVAAPPYLAGRADGVMRAPSRTRKDPAAVDAVFAAAPAPAPADVPAGPSAPLLSGAQIRGLSASIVQSSTRRAPRPSGGGEPPAPVHVTIGRIEVRASAPPAERPAVRRSPAGPRMSLDDYLTGQRRGSRGSR